MEQGCQARNAVSDKYHAISGRAVLEQWVMRVAVPSTPVTKKQTRAASGQSGCHRLVCPRLCTYDNEVTWDKGHGGADRWESERGVRDGDEEPRRVHSRHGVGNCHPRTKSGHHGSLALVVLPGCRGHGPLPRRRRLFRLLSIPAP